MIQKCSLKKNTAIYCVPEVRSTAGGTPRSEAKGLPGAVYIRTKVSTIRIKRTGIANRRRRRMKAVMRSVWRQGRQAQPALARTCYSAAAR